MRSRRWRLSHLESRMTPAVFQWDGGPSGNGVDWHDPINWIGDQLPGPSDAVVINTTGSNPLIQINSLAAVLNLTATRSLALNAGASLSLGASNSVASGIQLASGVLDLASGCELSFATITGVGNLNIPAARNVKLSLCTINVPMQVDGQLAVVEDLTVGADVTINNGGSVQIIGDSAPTILNVTGQIFNSGTIELTSVDGEQLARLRLNNGTLTSNATGQIKSNIGTGGARDIQLATSTSHFVNHGQLAIAADTTISRLGSGQTFSSSGGIAIDPNRTLTVNVPTTINGGTIQGGGSLSVSSMILNAKVTTALASLTLGGLSGTGEWTIPTGMTARTNANTNLQTAIVNHGSLVIRGSCSIGAGYVSQPGSVLRIQGETGFGPASLLTTSALTNQSVIELTSAGSSNNSTLIIGASPFVNGSAGTIKSQSGAGGIRTLNLQFAGAFTNKGTISLVDAGLTVAGQPLISDGTIIVAAGTTLMTTNPVTNSNSGLIAGLGTIKAGGLSSAGNIAPGPGAGILTATGPTTISGTVTMDLNGLSQFDQLRINGSVTLSGPLSVQLNYSAQVGDQFIILDNDNADAITGSFQLLPDGQQFQVGGATVEIDYQGGSGNDVSLKVVAVGPPPLSANVQINDGSAQRSMVTSLQVEFSAAPNFPDGVAAAFRLEHINPGQPPDLVGINVTGSGTTYVVTLNDPTFAPGPTHSLIDGSYSLRLIAAKIHGPGGPLNGGSDIEVATHRLFGDVNGDRSVTAADFAAFRLAYGGGPSVFDFDGDGGTNASDFNQFRLRYGQSV